MSQQESAHGGTFPPMAAPSDSSSSEDGDNQGEMDRCGNSLQTQSSPYSEDRPEPPLIPAADLTANWRTVWQELALEAAPPSQRGGGAPFGREDHSLCLHEGVLYLYGGWDSRQEPPTVFGDLWAMNLADSMITDSSSSLANSLPKRKQPKWTLLFDPVESENDPAQHGRFVPRPRWGHTADVIGNYMVVVGGTPNTETTEFEVILFDFKTRLWHRLATYETIDSRRFAASENRGDIRPLASSSRFSYAKYAQTLTASNRTSIDGAAFADPLDSLGELSGAAGKAVLGLRPVTLPVRYCHTTILHNGILVVFGGLQNEDVCTNDVVCIDIYGGQEKKSTEVPTAVIISAMPCTGTLPAPRFSHISCLVQPSSMFVFGGSNVEEANINFDQLHELNLSSFAWSVVQPNGLGSAPGSRTGGLQPSKPICPEGRCLHCAVADRHGLIYIFGGKFWDMRPAAPEMLLFNSRSHTWHRVARHLGQFPQSICGMACTIYQDDDTAGLRVIISSGEDESNDEMSNDVIELRVDAAMRRALVRSAEAAGTKAGDEFDRQDNDGFFPEPTPPISKKEAERSASPGSRMKPAALFSSLGSSSSIDPTIPATDTPRDPPPKRSSSHGSPPPQSEHGSTPPSSDLLAMHNWVQQLQRSVAYRFDEIESRLDETNRRIDRLRDVFLSTARGEGGLMAESRSFHAGILQELRSMREEQRRVLELVAAHHPNPIVPQ